MNAGGADVRWDNLFDDLEGQLEHELNAEDLDLQAEEERLRLGRMSLRDRITSIQASEPKHSSYSIRVRLTDGSVVDLRPATIGRDWFSADLMITPLTDSPGDARLSGGRTAQRSRCIVPIAALAAILMTRSQIGRSLATVDQAETERGLSNRLTLSFVLRDLCRRRSALELRTPSTTIFGTIDRVGRDHLDLAVHEREVARRESAVSQYCVVPFTELLLVRV